MTSRGLASGGKASRGKQSRASGAFMPVLIAGSAIMLVSFGIRSGFGLFQIPIADQFGWLRTDYSLAIAIQNLAWGVGQPLFAMVAERWGDRRALALGAVIYAVGLALSASAITPEGHQALNVLIGFGIAGTGFGVILAMVGRAAPDHRRSLALGVATAAGSAGQVVGPPVIERLLAVMSLHDTFLVLAALALGILLILPFLNAPARPATIPGEDGFATVVGRALRDPSFTLIFLGFFSCGYQLGFLTAHFPAFITEACGPIDPAGLMASAGVQTTAQLGAWAIALIGVTNIAGTLLAGALGGRHSRKYLLSGIYLGRTLIAGAFIIMPMTPETVLLFSVGMGALWLATVPLTAGLVGHIWGMRCMGILYGIVFFSHQVGSFMGVWLGGLLYDRFGSYDMVWWIGVGVGAFSAVVHLPVNEAPKGLPAPA
jgi:MFS family permease